MYPDIASLLEAHGITSPAVPLAHDGYSGALLSGIAQDGRRYVLKRFCLRDDWIMRWVGDNDGREAAFAASPVAQRLPPRIRVPMLGACRDGTGWALLMDDITPLLLPSEGVLEAAVVDEVLGRMAELHARFWDDPLDDALFPLLGLRERLTIVSPASAELLVREGLDFGAARGWQLFQLHAAPAAVRLITSLLADMTPILRTLERLPQTLLHGDLKFANIGVGEDVAWLIDWALVSRGPVAVDLAWFLAVNSSRLPWSLDETLVRYRRRLEQALGPQQSARWPEQMAATHVCGLLLYGWGKALDAEAGRPDELAWWCERALEGGRIE